MLTKHAIIPQFSLIHFFARILQFVILSATFYVRVILSPLDPRAYFSHGFILLLTVLLWCLIWYFFSFSADTQNAAFCSLCLSLSDSDIKFVPVTLFVTLLQERGIFRLWGRRWRQRVRNGRYSLHSRGWKWKLSHKFLSHFVQFRNSI